MVGRLQGILVFRQLRANGLNARLQPGREPLFDLVDDPGINRPAAQAVNHLGVEMQHQVAQLFVAGGLIRSAAAVHQFGAEAFQMVDQYVAQGFGAAGLLFNFGGQVKKPGKPGGVRLQPA